MLKSIICTDEVIIKKPGRQTDVQQNPQRGQGTHLGKTRQRQPCPTTRALLAPCAWHLIDTRRFVTKTDTDAVAKI